MPTTLTRNPNPQNDDIDPLELEDQTQPDEEVAELAHIDEDDVLNPDAGGIKVAEEEIAIVKEIEKIAVPEDAAPTKKSGTQAVSQALIERELTAEDWMDEGLL